MEILVKHTSAAPPRLSAVRPELPAALDAPVLAFLEKDPAGRPASVSAGLDALAVAAAGAGLDVKVVSRKTGGDSAAKLADTQPAVSSGPAVLVGGGATPAAASAQTMLSDAGKTVIAAEMTSKPASGRTMVYGAVGAVALIAAIGVGVVMRPGAGSRGARDEDDLGPRGDRDPDRDCEDGGAGQGGAGHHAERHRGAGGGAGGDRADLRCDAQGGRRVAGGRPRSAPRLRR